MSWIEEKYIQLLGPSLDLFKPTQDNKFNFRCPVCGDSQKSAYKARGYLLEHNNIWFFKCHNCFESMNFQSFLKYVDQALYDEYRKETFVSKKQHVFRKTKKIIEAKAKEAPNILSDVPRLSAVDQTHIANLYIKGRLIPDHCRKFLYYSNDINLVFNKLEKYKDRKLPNGDALLIPFYSQKHKLIYVQCRFLDPDTKKRYMTIAVDEDHTKIYGLDRINKKHPTFLVEGPLDSLFIRNGLAMAGADIPFQKLKMLNINPVFVYDNEQRNKQIIKKMSDAVIAGYNIVVWSNEFKQKDINDMVLAGHSIKKINHFLNENITSGPEAILKINKFKRV